jgi:hypothetical protein
MTDGEEVRAESPHPEEDKLTAPDSPMSNKQEKERNALLVSC